MDKVMSSSVWVALLAALALGTTAPRAFGKITGYRDMLALGGESSSGVNIGGSSLLAGTGSWGAYTFDLTASEFSYTLDWHSSATPLRNIRQLAYCAPNVGGLTYTYNLYKGVWNAGGGTNDFTLVQQLAVTDTFQFKPVFKNLTTPMIGATALKVVWVGGQNANTRRIPSFVAFEHPLNADREDPLVKLNGATSNYGWAGGNPLSYTYDDIQNVAVTSIGSSVPDAYITFTFTTPKYLSGLVFNINPIDDPVQFGWHGWKLYDTVGGNVIWDPANNTDRDQIYKFPLPRVLSTFTIQGPMNPDTGASGRGRFGEVWGVLAVSPKGTVLMGR